jgi:4-hydroxyacetophenone monooxygenase
MNDEAQQTPGSGRYEDRDRLDIAVGDANIPTLLMCLVQLTGDLRWLDPPYQPIRAGGISDNDTGGLPVAIQREVRAAAVDAMRASLGGKPPALPRPSEPLLNRMLSVSMGEPVPDRYGPMIASELNLGANITAANPTFELDGFTLIVGAGVSGLCAAVRLAEAGIPFVMVEQSDAVGGTWLENKYPGSGVDTPSHLYSFSFARYDWSAYFAKRDELKNYLDAVTLEFSLLRHIRFQTRVLSMYYDETQQCWHVRVQRRDGSVEILKPHFVVTAVGAFGSPKVPEIPGIGLFNGPCFHTAAWPADFDLNGKRVAVVGNGASAMQVVPAIAGIPTSVTVFQRSPQWAAPFEKFNVAVPESVRWLLREVELYRRWYRVRLGWIFNDRTFPALQKDPGWPHPDRSVNKINDGYRRALTRYIEFELGDRHDLRDIVVPTYPPFGKRMLLDNGWYRTLTRDDVCLVTDPVREITSDSLITSTGQRFEADVIVFATGFDVVHFLSGIQIVGRTGKTLREAWSDDDARAYLGLAVPDFPNLFTLYGPNLQTGHGGSLIFLVECQVNYLMELLQQASQRRLASIECRRDVYERYNAEVDEAHSRMIWTHPGMDTYYRNSRGRVVVNSPFSVVDFWHRTRTADLADWLTEPQRQK